MVTSVRPVPPLLGQVLVGLREGIAADRISTLTVPKKGAAASGGRGGRARTRSGDGEGWGRDRGRV